MSARGTTSLARKFMTAIMGTSIAVLALTCAVFITYEYVTFRKTLVQSLALRAEIIADNASAALAFQNEADGTEILATLVRDPHTMAACLFDKDGRIFARYPAAAPAGLFPAAPEKQGYRFGKAEVEGFHPVVRDNRRLGTLYLKSDLTAMSERFRLYAMLVVAVVAGSLFVAFALSSRLLKRITNPILNLAATAKIVSEQRDYSIRASRCENDEVGRLTEAFNQMLGEIQTQHADLKNRQEQLTKAVQVSEAAETALRESQARLGLALEAADIGYWELDMVTQAVRRSLRHDEIFGYDHSLPEWTYEAFLRHVHPEDRARVSESFQAGVATGDWKVECRIIRADQTVRWIWARGHVFTNSAGQQARMLGLVADITERKNAEAMRARLAAVVEHSDDAIISKTLDGIIHSWNESATRLFGYSAAEAIGQPVTMLIPPGQENEEPAIIARLTRGESTSHYETRRRRKDGTLIDVSLTVSPVKDESGRIVGASKIVRDITERKRAEAALRTSEERYRGLFTTLIEGFCIVEVLFDALDRPIDYRFLEVNSRFEALTGLRDAQGKRRRELAPAHDEDWFATFGRVALTGESARFVIQAKAQNRWFDVSANRVGGRDSRKVAIVFNDITDRKRAEQKIREQLEHLRLLDQITRTTGERLDLKSIFQSTLVSLEDKLPIDFGCVCLHDPVENVLRVTCVGARSGALARELKLDEQAVIDIDANGLSRCVQGRLVYEPDIGQVRFAFPQLLSRGGLGSLVMAPLRSESRGFGVLVVARRAAHAFDSAECEFLRQLSEHVALAAQQAQLHGALQQAYDDLRQTQQAAMQEERLRALGQMASGIAHDINNALSPVSLYVESMLETERSLSERGRGYLETIQRAVEDVAETVARMREFYRQRDQQLVLTPVQINSMVQQVVDLTRARWRDMPQQRGVMIRALTELAPDLPQVMGVESEIREALTNLVFNAVDAMPEGGTVTLRTRLAGADPARPAVAVEVSDTGVGMDEETRRRCLEPFFTTKGERGTGLGLAMVFGMVKRHSAEIEIDSAPGTGTTVRLVFAVPTAVQVAPGPRAAPETPSGLRLLLIDDDPMLLQSLQDTLQGDGHFIVTASGGEAGISAFHSALGRGEPFAAVVTDLGMPYVDGRRVAAAVKEGSPATPVILLTGWGLRLVAEGDIPPHVDRVLAKPPRLHEVREALALLCAGPRRPERIA